MSAFYHMFIWKRNRFWKSICETVAVEYEYARILPFDLACTLCYNCCALNCVSRSGHSPCMCLSEIPGSSLGVIGITMRYFDIGTVDEVHVFKTDGFQDTYLTVCKFCKLLTQDVPGIEVSVTSRQRFTWGTICVVWAICSAYIVDTLEAGTKFSSNFCWYIPHSYLEVEQ